MRAVRLERAQALARRLSALEEGPMRTRAAARALAAARPAEAAELLADAATLAGRGEPALATALGLALLEPGPDLAYDDLAAIHAAAAEEGLGTVRALLVAPAPRAAFEEPRDHDVAVAHLSLGHKKAMARGKADPDLLARLAAEGEPSVVRELLRNPRLTEEQVVRLAARRPCRPATLSAVYQDRRWRSRPAVLRALALNPYAEPALVSKLLPRLGTPALEAIATDGSLHPLVRGLASRLVQGRLDDGPGGATAAGGRTGSGD